MNYLTRTNNGIKISKSNEIFYLNNSLKYTINNLCKSNLSTMNGRVESVRSIFEYKSLIPIYVDSNTLLFPTASLRDFFVYFVNYNEILFVNNKDDFLILTFKDLTELRLDLSYDKLNKQMIRCKIIDEYLNSL